jgi:hypothetical protein
MKIQFYQCGCTTYEEYLKVFSNLFHGWASHKQRETNVLKSSNLNEGGT